MRQKPAKKKREKKATKKNVRTTRKNKTSKKLFGFHALIEDWRTSDTNEYRFLIQSKLSFH